jgi:hypothetical protein
MQRDYFVVGCFAVENGRRFTGPEEAFQYLREEADGGYGIPDCPPVYSINKKSSFVMLPSAQNMKIGYTSAALALVDRYPEVSDPFGPAGCIEVKGLFKDAKGILFGWIFCGFIPNAAQERMGEEAYHAYIEEGENYVE